MITLKPHECAWLSNGARPIPLKRIPENGVVEWLEARNPMNWQHEADAALSFASPGLAIIGKPAV
jgi:hypothetical protein